MKFTVKKIILVLLTALVLVFLLLFFRSKVVQTNVGLGIREIEKIKPTVLVTKDEDGYGLQILAKGLKNVSKVEMLVGYKYKGKENPPLLASGPPQQDSYWAHFRFESCSRGDCLYYKIDEAKFSLTLIYEDGESKDYSTVIRMPNVSQDTLLEI